MLCCWYRADKDRASHDGRPVWMRSLLTTASEWLSMVPQSLDVLRRTADNIKDPLFRFFEREVSYSKPPCHVSRLSWEQEQQLSHFPHCFRGSTIRQSIYPMATILF